MPVLKSWNKRNRRKSISSILIVLMFLSMLPTVVLAAPAPVTTIAVPLIDSVRLTPGAHAMGIPQTISVSVQTRDVQDGTPVSAALYDTAGGMHSAVVTGVVNRTRASLDLFVDADAPAGSYRIRVTVPGIATHETSYTITPIAVPLIEWVSSLPSAQAMGISQTIRVTVGTRDVQDGTPISAALYDTAGGMHSAVVTGVVNQNQAFLDLFVDADAPAGSYRIRVTVPGIDTHESSHTITPIAVPSIEWVSRWPSAHAMGIRQGIWVDVETRDVQDGTHVSAAVYDTAGGMHSAVGTGVVKQNRAFLVLFVDAYAPAGSYRIRVTIPGLTPHETSHTITSAAVPLVEGVYLYLGHEVIRAAHAMGIPQRIWVNVQTRDVQDGTPVSVALYDTAGGMHSAVVTGVVNQNRASLDLFVDDDAPAGSYRIRVTVPGIATHETSYTITPIAVPLIEWVMHSPRAHSMGIPQTIEVSVMTRDVQDGTLVSAALYDTAGGRHSAVVTGVVNRNLASLYLFVDDDAPAGSYRIRVTVPGRALYETSYTITPIAVPLIESVSLWPSAHAMGVPQTIAVWVQTRDVQDGTPVSVALYDTAGGMHRAVVTGVVNQNWAYLGLFVDADAPAGSYRIQVTIPGLTPHKTSYTITSTLPFPVTAVTVAPTEATINVGANQQLTAMVAPANATNKAVTWTSSNDLVATVDADGLVTGVAAGTATITVTTVDGARIAISTITVVVPTPTPTPGPGPGPAPTPTPTPTPPAVVEQPIVAGQVTEVELEDVVTVTITAGAITGAAPKVAAQVMPAAAAAELIAKATGVGLTAASEVVVLTMTGGEFTAPVQLKLNFDSAKVAAGQIPGVFVYNERTGRWIFLGGQVGVGTITVTVDRFSKFAVFATTPLPVLADIADHWGRGSIRTLAGMGIVSGFPDGNFNPNAGVTRAEFVSMLTRALGLTAKPEAAARFTDAAGWAQGAIGAAAEAGLVVGYADGTFGGSRRITRAEMAAILLRVIRKGLVAVTFTAGVDFADAGAFPAWAADSIGTANTAGLVRGFPDRTFRPGSTTTRAEAAAMLYRLLAER